MKHNKLKLAVASAVLAFGSQVASAGIIIPAGDWTVDLSGNVNTFYSNTDFTGELSRSSITAGTNSASVQVVTASMTGAGVGVASIVTISNAATAATTRTLGARAAGSAQTKNANQISTGLLPSAIGIGAKTRQNDLDVAIQTTFFVGANSAGGGTGAYNNAVNGLNSLNIRQAFLSFGDKAGVLLNWVVI